MPLLVSARTGIHIVDNESTWKSSTSTWEKQNSYSKTRARTWRRIHWEERSFMHYGIHLHSQIRWATVHSYNTISVRKCGPKKKKKIRSLNTAQGQIRAKFAKRKLKKKNRQLPRMWELVVSAAFFCFLSVFCLKQLNASLTPCCSLVAMSLRCRAPGAGSILVEAAAFR